MLVVAVQASERFKPRCCSSDITSVNETVSTLPKDLERTVDILRGTILFYVFDQTRYAVYVIFR